MKIAICDDDINIIKTINTYINDLFSDFAPEIYTYKCGEDLIYENRTFDFAFIDVEMGSVNGLKIAKHCLEKNRNSIIFIVTSYQSYLDEAMDLNVYRYISKPIDKERFINCLSSAKKKYFESSKQLTVETASGIKVITASDILYITINGRKTVIVTEKEKYETNQKFSYWKSVLNQDIFVQPYGSYIVNLEYVTELNRKSLTVSSGTFKEEIYVSQRFYKRFREAFFAYVGGLL
ncbi:MAG: response regulator transcription factor [Ruminococcus sp.]|nr:response regulator transcription factor [Candidatus Copronaster equi]